MGYLSLFQDELIYIYIIAAAILLVLVLLIFFKFTRKKPKQKEITLEKTYLESLGVALGDYQNIKSVQSEHQRLKVIVNDIKKVDSKKLSELSIPTFLKGKELTLLIKNHIKEVLSYLNDKIREGN